MSVFTRSSSQKVRQRRSNIRGSDSNFISLLSSHCFHYHRLIHNQCKTIADWLTSRHGHLVCSTLQLHVLRTAHYVTDYEYHFKDVILVFAKTQPEDSNGRPSYSKEMSSTLTNHRGLNTYANERFIIILRQQRWNR